MSAAFPTITAALLAHYERKPDKIAFRILDRHADDLDRVTYGELFERACNFAAQITTASRPGARIVLALPTGVDFLVGLFGCLLSGRIAVPSAYPQAGALEAFERIVLDCDAEVIVAEPDRLTSLSENVSMRRVVTPQQMAGGSKRIVHAPDPGSPAVLQYSSGSTRQPRAVIVTHGNIAANHGMISDRFGHSGCSDFVSWLPLYHDMGLIGAVIQPVMLGSTSTLMSPAQFSRRPRLWLEAITRYRAHTSGGPDSSYRLCVQAIKPGDLGGLDLSHWAVAYNGAEPVRLDTLRAFTSMFGAAGFRPQAFLPCYGLAEATLFVAGSHFDPARSDEPGALPTVGSEAKGLRIAIVDPVTAAPASAGAVGEICIAGANVSPGYWNSDPGLIGFDDNQFMLGKDRFFRTGDLGTMMDHGLRITGRLKDIIIRAGQNIVPDDIEAAVESVNPDTGCQAAAVGIDTPDGESMVVVAEVTRRTHRQDLAAQAEAIWTRLEARHGIMPDRIAFVQRGQLPRTTSGKIRRGAIREMLARNQLPAIAWFPGATGLALDRAATEDAIVEAAAAMLGVESVERSIPFAALGMDSLSSMRLRGRLAARFGERTPPTQAMLGHSVRTLALRIAATEATALAAVPTSGGGVRPILVTHATAADPAALNLAVLISADHGMSERKIVDAVRAVASRHPQLVTVADGLWQERRTESLRNETVRRVVCAPADIAALVAAEVRRPFMPATEPLLRSTLLVPKQQSPMLLLVVHHAVADLWSMALLARGLAAAYAGTLETSPAVRPADARPIPGWRNHGGTSLRLPASPPLFGPSRSFRSAQDQRHLRAHIGAGLADDLRRTAAALSVTLFELCLLAFAEALADLFAREEVSILVPRQRRAPDEEATSGYFVSPQLVTVSRTKAASPREALENLRLALSTAIEIERIAGAADGERLAFDVAFLWQQLAPDVPSALARLALPDNDVAVKVGDLVLTRPAEAIPPPFHPFELTVVPEEGELLAAAAYRSLVVEPALAEAIIAAWIAKLDLLAGRRSEPQPDRDHDPEAAVLPTLQPASLHAMIEGWADRTPHAVAVRHDGLTTSYAELDSYSNAIAHALARRGVGAGHVVAIAMREGARHVAAILATLKTGAAFLGFEIGSPPARVTAMLQDAAASFAVVETDQTPAISAIRAVLGDRLLEIDDRLLERGPFTRLDAVVDSDQPAYVVFTSGSTGRPKGIRHSHASLARFISWQSDCLEIGRSAVMASVAAVGFDVNYCELFGALCFGACLSIAKRPDDLLPDRLFDFLRREHVTALQILPSALDRALEREGDRADTALRALFLVGEALSGPIARRAVEVLGPGIAVWNVYGPSETIAASAHRVSEPDFDSAIVPIGRAIPGRRLHVLSDSLGYCSVGVQGEIVIETNDRCQGYIGNSAIDAGRFVGPAQSRLFKAAAFRTGDLGTLAPHGILQFNSRRDNQIKIAGLRIEIEEIEAAIRTLLNYANVVLPDCFPGGGSGLTAVLETDGPDLDIGALRGELLKHLALAMVPTRFVVTRALPRLPNGKADRHAAADLAALPQSVAAPAAQDQPPEAIVAAWSRILGTPPRDISANFFREGGHSLLAMQLVNALAGISGRSLLLAEFLRDPTPGRLAEMMDRNPDAEGADLTHITLP